MTLAEKLTQVGFAVFTKDQKRELEKREQFLDVPPTEAWISRYLAGRNLMDQLLSYGLRGYVVAPLLRDADVMSMSQSLEVRVPFLDHVLIETVCRLPRRFKYRRGRSKFLIRRFARGLLPPAVFGPKRGFTLPMDGWLRGRLRPVVEDALSNERVLERNLFNHREVERIKASFFAGRENYARTWSLTVLESWLRRSVDTGRP